MKRLSAVVLAVALLTRRRTLSIKCPECRARLTLARREGDALSSPYGGRRFVGYRLFWHVAFKIDAPVRAKSGAAVIAAKANRQISRQCL